MSVGYYFVGAYRMNKPMVLPGVDKNTLVNKSRRDSISEGLATASHIGIKEVFTRKMK